jgi:hypothetical protein
MHVRYPVGWLSLAACLALLSAAPAPATSAQAIGIAPPGPALDPILVSTGPTAEVVYPREPQEVEILGGGGIRIRQLKTVKTRLGHKAVADRLIVGFHGPLNEDTADAHRRAASRLRCRRGRSRRWVPEVSSST